MGCRHIKVGGAVVEVRIDDSCVSELDRVFDGFLGETGNADYRLFLHPSTHAHTTGFSLMPDRHEMVKIRKILERRFPFTGLASVALPKKRREGGTSTPVAGAFERVSLKAMEDGSMSLVVAPSFMLAVDHERKTADALLYAGESEGDHAAAALAIQALYGVMLPEYGAMMLHAAAIDLEGRGILFVGGADVGKTTLSSRVSRDRLLSDDGAVCICHNGTVSIVPSPFSQTPVGVARLEDTRLSSLMFLIQDETDYLESIRPGEAMVSVLYNHIHFFRFMNPQNARLTFQMIEYIINNIPIARLHFSRDFDPTAFFSER